MIVVDDARYGQWRVSGTTEDSDLLKVHLK
jgi:hypothetical protein